MDFYSLANEKWNNIAMPLGSLGILQEHVNKICNIQQTLNPHINKKCVAVFCADNGIVAQGVTQSESEVTSIVANNICHGKSGMCKMAEIANADVFPIDIGMKFPVDSDKIIQKSIMRGTNDFSKMKAMEKNQVLQAIDIGMEFVKNHLEYDVFAIGEMGIGNTTTSSAVASVILGINVNEVTDKGAGLSSEGVLHKISVIEQAIKKHTPDKNDVYDVLSKIGGLDICGMIGVIIACKKYKKICILDGFISLVAFICAEKIDSKISNFVISSHVSDYKLSGEILKSYNLNPIIHAQMRLGEGSGAVAIMPILDMAVKIFNEMPRFVDVNIDKYEQF